MKGSPLERRYRIPDGPGALFVRNLPPAIGQPQEGRTVLYVHGATFPSALSVAYRFDGYSWMDDLAAGFDAWAFEFAGYGKSDRYPETSDTIDPRNPPGRVAEASIQIAAVVAFILETTGASRVSIVAHSWGTLAAGHFATTSPQRADRLAFFGPIARRQGSGPLRLGGATSDSHAPYRYLSVDDQWKRFNGEVPPGEPPVIADRHFATWGPDYLATDPDSGSRTPPAVRVPSGPAVDIAAAWSGEFPYDPARILAPTLIARGEWDTLSTDADARWLFNAMTAAPLKRDVVVSRGTLVMHLEESRFQLYREVQLFLEGRDTPETRRQSRARQ